MSVFLFSFIDNCHFISNALNIYYFIDQSFCSMHKIEFIFLENQQYICKYISNLCGQSQILHYGFTVSFPGHYIEVGKKKSFISHLLMFDIVYNYSLHVDVPFSSQFWGKHIYCLFLLPSFICKFVQHSENCLL